MKLCIECYQAFDKEAWQCPACCWAPLMSHGFYAFAPELADSNSGMDEHAHHVLDKIQEHSFWFRKRNQLIQDMIKRFFPSAKNVLEIGCGSGYVASGIRHALPEAKISATEIYTNGLAYAAKRVSAPSQFLQVDARKLPFQHEFDLVGAFDVLEHIEEDELVIKNIRRSLQNNGGLILTVPQHQWLWSRVDEVACHKRRYHRKQLNSLLQQNDFEILLDTSFMFFLLPLMLMQRSFASKKQDYDVKKELALPRWLDRVFESILACERWMIGCGIRFPIGGSRLVVARLKH